MALQESLRIIEKESWRREQLQTLAARLRSGLAGLPWNLLPSQTAIQPSVLGDNTKALKVAKTLEAQGYLVSAIRPPTVPEGQARLRVTLTALHTEEHVDGLIKALASALEDSRNNAEENVES